VPIAIETDLRIIQDCLMEALNKIRALSYLIPPVAMVAHVALKRFRGIACLIDAITSRFRRSA
jgi:hypothetical protein